MLFDKNNHFSSVLGLSELFSEPTYKERETLRPYCPCFSSQVCSLARRVQSPPSLRQQMKTRKGRGKQKNVKRKEELLDSSPACFSKQAAITFISKLVTYTL